MKRASLFFFMIATIGVSLCGPAAGQTTIPINPKATYLRVEAGDAATLDATAIVLAALNIAPGDTIHLKRVGSYDCGSASHCLQGATTTVGVFSSSAVLLDRDQQHRVRDAIDAGEDVYTWPSFSDSLATDITEDFLIEDTTVVVPAGVTHLFVSPHDSRFRDNRDVDGDYGLEISQEPQQAVAAAQENEPGVPSQYVLHQNYPNPFASATTIGFDLPRPSQVALRVYDVLGREVAALAVGRRPAGHHAVVWDAADAPSGVYVYKLKTGAHVETRKLILQR